MPVLELVGTDHPGIPDIDHVGSEDVQADPQADQKDGRGQQPRGRDGDTQRAARYPDPEGEQQHPHQQVAEKRVHERHRHPDIAVIEEGERDREPEQHQQVDVQQPPPRTVSPLATAATAAQPGPGDERGHEQGTQRQPYVQRVDAAAERAGVAAGHPPGDLPAGPHLRDPADRVVHIDLDPLVLRALAREEADLPLAVAVRVDVGLGTGVLPARSLDPCVGLSDRQDLAGRELVAHRRQVHVGDQHGRAGGGGGDERLIAGCPCGSGQHQRGERQGERERDAQATSQVRPETSAQARKLHSFWPTNDRGVPAAIEIACAMTFAMPAPSTRDTSTA